MNSENEFFVSFNSPQCGWMSIGLAGGAAEFHTTTAHAPHTRALSELLGILTELLDAGSAKNEFLLQWNRNPEEFDFEFRRGGATVNLQIFQYPGERREAAAREKVFEFTGEIRQVCAAFYATFAQMKTDKDVDDFEQNWRQPFPREEFDRFENSLKNSN